jgi:hypothetical protein
MASLVQHDKWDCRTSRVEGQRLRVLHACWGPKRRLVNRVPQRWTPPRAIPDGHCSERRTWANPVRFLFINDVMDYLLTKLDLHTFVSFGHSVTL